MSSKVKNVTRSLDFTATWTTDVLTVTTATHNLLTGNVVTLVAGDSPQIITGAVTVVDATSFTMVALSEYSTFNSGKLTTNAFSTGFASRVMFTLPRGTANAAVVQSYVSGAGGAAYTLDLSLDGVHWVNAASVTHPTTNADTGFNTIGPAWAYASLNITAVGAATTMYAMYSA